MPAQDRETNPKGASVPVSLGWQVVMPLILCGISYGAMRADVNGVSASLARACTDHDKIRAEIATETDRQTSIEARVRANEIIVGRTLEKLEWLCRTVERIDARLAKDGARQ